MNRRQILAAAGLAVVSRLASAGTISTLPGQGKPARAGLCALHPITTDRAFAGVPITQLRIVRFQPDQLVSDIRSLDFDVRVLDSGSLPQTIFAWQLKRLTMGVISTSNSLRMRFPLGTQMDIEATVRTRAGKSAVYNNRLVNGSLMALVTARSSTGAPPALLDLRFNSSSGELALANGRPRDFDTLIIQTS